MVFGLGWFKHEPKPGEKMGFGPNSVTVTVRRAKRDPITHEAIIGKDGKVVYLDKVEIYRNWNTTISAGLDAAKDRLFNTATAQTVAKYIALSESTHAPDAGDTALDAEITKNGLERAAASYSVGGCSTGECILSNAFTATGTFTAVQLMGLFDVTGTAGDMYFEATITAVALESGDQLTAQWNKITIS